MSHEPTRSEVDHFSGPVVLEFGASWCPHCIAIQSDLTAQLARFPKIRHVRIEDGRGKPLGRSFRVKLWPTLVFLNDGVELQRVVRPGSQELAQAFDDLAAIAAFEGPSS